ncbi:PIG-L deacetylase family protein [Bacillus sp. V2I10]|uniref:PIG-L deacetylase family protein n=1 Tax=Bacillus sp. V2I10 TaxID=3042276 RepID=UPI00277F577C|nr:PIG-L family deacetylase [Bacillus sp. V2I10]MDQ0857818.1 LmbE family N-acetylglucosaminyl deacetylase [Bacillus sp. V2I10]
MKKTAVLLTVFIFCILGFTENDVKAADLKENKVVIYYVPHQDDELLSMGVGILNDVERGYEVHLVLYTDGLASNVQHTLNLTPEQFGKARDKEFIRSALALRVKPNNLHFLNLQDRKVTKEDMREVIQKFEKKYPGAKHRAYSYYDKHNDHNVAGEALNALYNEGEINEDVKFYINYGRYDTKGIEEPYNERKYKKRLKMGIRAYNINMPKFGFYGIGRKSAGDLFVNLEKNPKSLYHLPNYKE